MSQASRSILSPVGSEVSTRYRATNCKPAVLGKASAANPASPEATKKNRQMRKRPFCALQLNTGSRSWSLEVFPCLTARKPRSQVSAKSRRTGFQVGEQKPISIDQSAMQRVLHKCSTSALTPLGLRGLQAFWVKRRSTPPNTKIANM